MRYMLVHTDCSEPQGLVTVFNLEELITKYGAQTAASSVLPGIDKLWMSHMDSETTLEDLAQELEELQGVQSLRTSAFAQCRA